MKETVLYPMVAQGALIFSVLLLLMRRRLKAFAAGETDPKYFRLLQGTGEPDTVTQAQRNYLNQFEMPTLFFVGGILAAVFDRVDVVLVYAAWAFVAVRFIHTIVHVSGNNVLLRFRLFFLSNVILFFMWVWMVL